MGGQERTALTAIVLNLLVNGSIALLLAQSFARGGLYGDGGLQAWGQTVVWAIPALLALTVLSHGLAHLLSRDRVAGAIVDERDRSFRLRGLAVTTTVAGLSFVVAIAALAYGVQAIHAFTMQYVGMALADLSGNVVRFLSYRFGA